MKYLLFGFKLILVINLRRIRAFFWSFAAYVSRKLNYRVLETDVGIIGAPHVRLILR